MNRFNHESVVLYESKWKHQEYVHIMMATRILNTHSRVETKLRQGKGKVSYAIHMASVKEQALGAQLRYASQRSERPRKSQIPTKSPKEKPTYLSQSRFRCEG